MSEVFQSATITPASVLAADSVEFVIRLVIGPGYQSTTGRIAFEFMQRLGASPPSLWLNEDSGYVEAYISNPRASWRKRLWDFRRQRFVDRENPPSQYGERMVLLDVEGKLDAGDVVELHWGETTMGFGPGAKVSSVVPREVHEEVIEIRYFAAPTDTPDLGYDFPGYVRPVPDAETEVRFRILPRPPARLRLLRKLNKALLIPYDPFWNIARVDDLATLVDGPPGAQRNPGGVFEYADKNVQIKSRALPLTSAPPTDEVFGGMHLYWGDLHTHSKYSVDCLTCSRMDMTPGELMAFARYRSGLDFFAVTDHHCPGHDVISDSVGATLIRPDDWEATLADIRAHHADGEFVVIPGFEYSYPRGDTVVLMNWLPTYTEMCPANCFNIRDLWEIWKARDYISIPHFHAPGHLPPGEWWSNPRFESEPVLEILSDHGSYEREAVSESGRAACKRFREDRCGVHFLKHGYKYGFVGHSDDHKGHVGVNALTAIFSTSLDRDAVFDAYRKRRVYATSNARIRLLFTANGHLMGSEIPNTAEKELRIDVTAENRLKRIDLFRNGDPYQCFVPDGLTFQMVLKLDDPAPSNWYVRVTQIDNHVAISSPVWFVEAGCDPRADG